MDNYLKAIEAAKETMTTWPGWLKVSNPPQIGVQEAAFLDAMVRELVEARGKFPDSRGSMTALTEEVGELAKALLDEPRARVYAEAVQVAAMALRVAIDGDPTLDEIRARRGTETP